MKLKQYGEKTYGYNMHVTSQKRLPLRGFLECEDGVFPFLLYLF